MYIYVYSVFDSSTTQYLECKIIALPRKYEFKPYAFAFQTDSPYLKLFNYYINRLRESGALEKIHKAYQPAPQVCPNLTGKALGFKNCISAFLVILVGFGFAIFLLIGEYLLKGIVGKMTKDQSNMKEEDVAQDPPNVWLE